MNAKLLKLSRLARQHKLILIIFGCGATFTSFKSWSKRKYFVERKSPAYLHWEAEAKKTVDITRIPSRSTQLKALRAHNSTLEELDVLIIGGGATGAGIALDGITRGLKVALIDKSDFASGTSGRSTKLIHGGVRYLEKAVLRLDRGEWNLVKEAIAERAHLIHISPHIAYPIPIIIPIFDDFLLRGYFNLLRYYVGCKIYDAMAGQDGLLCPSYYLSAPHARNMFPQLRQQNLIGSVVYFDGQHNDARMNLLIALTAGHYGAIVANHVQLVDFIRDQRGNKIIGARLRDVLTGIEWNTYAKVIVNATGPFVDSIRKLDNGYVSPLIVPSQGTHLVLPGTFTRNNFGLLVPKTKDGRVAFMLPWENITLAGTTDKMCDVADMPSPMSTDAVEILSEINRYLANPADVSDVDAAWVCVCVCVCVYFFGFFFHLTLLLRVSLKTKQKNWVSILTWKKGWEGIFFFFSKMRSNNLFVHFFFKRCVCTYKHIVAHATSKSTMISCDETLLIKQKEEVLKRQRTEHMKQLREYLKKKSRKSIDDNTNANNKGANNASDNDRNKSENTSDISRQHLIEILPSGLITIAGGKWTTYRQMAEDVMDVVCQTRPELGRKAAECVTTAVKLVGSANWTQSVSAILERHQVPKDIAEHLSKNYGDKSFIVGDLYLQEHKNRLAGGYPYTEAEVIYCSKYEMAETAIDVLARRTRLAFVSRAAAEYALPRVIALMGSVHGWDGRTRVRQYHEACEFLRTMHVADRHKWGRRRHTLEYARRVVETVLAGPSMTDEAILFVIDKFMQCYDRQEQDEERDQTIENESPQGDSITKSEFDSEFESDPNANAEITAIETEEEWQEWRINQMKAEQSRQLFEGCISREKAYILANEFAKVFGDDRVIDAVMFTGMKQLGLYEILVSCAACAAGPDQFDPPGPWILI
ncbi:hypothetical protein RFI_10237 [Reticulomyxa filosa]|uniref:Glycerol-3-phosphate dehydrogenase n=1 Tax=Reticulomyxa filosa TaxID=46433 RepID=X6NNG0_RETFI|nr:hypothetical protein RFI_10237 [Reticulomyxa filosa]|eukprot:ETO26897.1 hypothetical protein RFI_10237 [Reticulomyxa filosa]